MKKKLLLTVIALTLLLTSCGQPAASPTPTAEAEKATPTTTATATEQRQIATPTEAAPPPPPSDLEKLLIDVFAPQLGEKVLVMSDLPHGKWTDNERWADRREMAIVWHSAFQQLGTKLGFTVHPLLTYPATGAHNGPLPEEGEMDGQRVHFEEILTETNIVVAPTEYSATAPLIEFSQKLPNLRAASMPGAMKSMEQTALAADYSEVARRSHILAAKLD